MPSLFPKSLRRSDSPYINHFIQPDTIIPNLSNPQSWNRYSYVINNPVKLIDPSGHKCVGDEDGCIAGEGGTGPRKIIYRNVNYCDTHPGACHSGDSTKKSDKDLKMTVDGFYLGGQYPQTLAETEADIYQGNAVDLIDSLSSRADAVNNSHGIPNVYAGLSYSQYADGSMDVTGITVANASDYRVFVIQLLFIAKGKPSTDFLAMNALSESYMPNPTRIGPSINGDKFMAVDAHSTQTLTLTPSGNAANPSNHFGPSLVQSLTARIVFAFAVEPRTQILTINLLP